MKYLSVVIPAYNEEKNIIPTLKVTIEYLANKLKKDWELIVVDDGSTDETCALVGNFISASPQMRDNIKLLRNERNLGKGAAVRKGVMTAQGEIRLFMDADNSTSIHEFDKFLPYLKEGYDVVIASRRLKDSMVEEPQPLLRAKMGQFYIFLSKIILGLNSSDFNCGFKAYNAKTTRHIFELQNMNDWSFDVELLFLIHKYSLKIKEVPVRWVHKSGSKVRPVKDAMRSFLSVIKIKLLDLTHFYEIK